MSDSFNPERKSACLKKQNLFGSGYAGLGPSKADSNATTAYPSTMSSSDLNQSDSLRMARNQDRES